MSATHQFVCFSDIDGTLVHYLDSPEQVQEVRSDTLADLQSPPSDSRTFSVAEVCKDPTVTVRAPNRLLVTCIGCPPLQQAGR
jgi:hypothetical protein